ncbi:heptaprenyl diphosphate synthase component 1 [Fervidibacillus halotolerans]|uniref:Heptaprenyl diphosphate synthase component 1 n=1 Tax=Fervidibacillus halotolerans TaxID=2980027 RepID=A0A9E8M1F8_9BACI|nr:heptaprenyl diphosphate synthase component 1 [Fervidibacillus halotolerans]WAA13763.1 heptaprenyl diphosphate synthase component 1 [Fervidibacillus halotolerans]
MKWDNSLLKQVKEKIEKEINHPFLVENIDSPKIDEQKLRLVLSILHGQNLRKRELMNYATAVMLVQIALDTHDLIHVKDETRQKKQLTVLAGDFYSGLYYRMLSFVPNIQLIKDLADGIKTVNEKKLQLYNKEVSTLQGFMEKMQMIETVIYQKLASFFQDEFWQSVSKDYLHYQQIKMNREKYVDYILTYLMGEKNPFHVTKTSVTIDQWFERYEQNVYERLKRSFQGVPDPLHLMSSDFHLDEEAKRSFI